MFIGIATVIVGVGVLALSFRSRDKAEGLVRLPYIGSVSTATGTTIAVVLIFAGYHFFSYEAPEEWMIFGVPERFKWLVYAGSVLAVIGAFAADKQDSFGQDKRN